MLFSLLVAAITFQVMKFRIKIAITFFVHLFFKDYGKILCGQQNAWAGDHPKGVGRIVLFSLEEENEWV